MIVHESPYSVIVVNTANRLLECAWRKDAGALSEEEVIAEITKVSDTVQAHNIQCILVDATLYPFRDNMALQKWINTQYMPFIVDCGVKRYAIVAQQMVRSNLESLEELIEDEESMEMRYFTQVEEAKNWLLS